MDNTGIELRDGPDGPVAFIAGHRVRVEDIAIWNEEGYSPEQIVAMFPSITLADAYAALAYYFNHRDEIERRASEEEKLILGSNGAL